MVVLLKSLRSNNRFCTSPQTHFTDDSPEKNSYLCFDLITITYMQVACLEEEIELIANQMASLALDVTGYTSYQVTENSYSDLAFGCNDMSLENCINQQIEVEPFALSGINACEDSEMMVQLPPLNGWEDDIFQLCSNSNISEIGLFEEEFRQTICQQYLWTEDCSTFN